MKTVFERIGERSKAFAERPLFQFLRDRSVEARRRLAFVPHMAHFVMTFADLYKFVLPENPPRDSYQELVNAHVQEDAGHWKWFLADLTNAHLDPALPFTEALKRVWSDQTVQTRLLSYDICQIHATASTLERLVMVQCIEATGSVGLAALSFAGSAIEVGGDRRLVYFGSHHVETESDHTLERPGVRSSLEGVTVSDSERARMLAIVDRVFARFESSVDEMFRIASARDGTSSTGGDES